MPKGTLTITQRAILVALKCVVENGIFLSSLNITTQDAPSGAIKVSFRKYQHSNVLNQKHLLSEYFINPTSEDCVVAFSVNKACGSNESYIVENVRNAERFGAAATAACLYIFLSYDLGPEFSLSVTESPTKDRFHVFFLTPTPFYISDHVSVDVSYDFRVTKVYGGR